MNRGSTILIVAIWAALMTISLIIVHDPAMAQGPTGDVIYEVRAKDGKRLCLYNNGTWGPATHNEQEGWQCPPPMALPYIPRPSKPCKDWRLHPEAGIICFWQEDQLEDLMCLPFDLDFYNNVARKVIENEKEIPFDRRDSDRPRAPHREHLCPGCCP